MDKITFINRIKARFSINMKKKENIVNNEEIGKRNRIYAGVLATRRVDGRIRLLVPSASRRYYY